MIFALLLLPLLSFAHVVTDDVSVTEKNPFNFQSVCKSMVTHETPLIEPVSGTELDCMGKKVQASDFCLKAMAADPYYLRAYVDKEKKQVVCVSGKKVIFKYLCVKLSDQEICGAGAQESCKVIQHKLARRLDVVHSSFTKNDKGIRQLNCYFESLPLKEK
ncbi:MAG TPA: hypothetical protein VNJ01_09990 [Bacteriovoracaceae bacterium]|nr:hypothetical protein [Bacteriovoracaceae bacterium]